ncbi:ATP-dependent RNA helicase HrpA [Clavibacter michiganensis subsp. michiganensis]|uniref:ATP-dependent RNA helicase HrpA n=1 Tax=Clavibacter michiganensis subsp. michiganensis TaxID=33013 RepID=A0A251XK65_CLAMM|nr:ATP-dependent RNA helicase HrpA [Clavibacter michiganensis subsp. michiganensis]
MEFSIAYPPELPVSRMRDEIADAIRDNQVVIVAGATGSGKTTQLPKICLELGRESIGHTQPAGSPRAPSRSASRRSSAARSASSSATRCASPTRSRPTPASSS